MSNRIVEVQYGDFFVLEPNVWKGKVTGCYARQVIAFVLDESNDVVSYVTATKTVPHGCAVWMPEGTVETPDQEWADIESYNAHLKQTLLS